MTDNGPGYVVKLFGEALRILGIRHIRTRPYTPKTNGKAERFIQTKLREWTYAIPFKSSDTPAVALDRWLSWYNERRPHSALNRRPPEQGLRGTTRSEMATKSPSVLRRTFLCIALKERMAFLPFQ
jgi:transposase InsO family protein